ncbi:DUF262 domain-containing protein [Crocosphaera sp. Alani8]|uniref:DUF262 domain-containing protein n=1 Tax=Crocosphaera sp. Alani8 TaxID=3038952 RepID=UPI00313AF714
MQASETKLQQIIEGTKQYVVPLFQRPYSWKKQQWQVLWDDLIELYESDQPRPHFMGSIVTSPMEAIPEGTTKYLLIDGQQRLTTIFLFLVALRDKAEDLKQTKLSAQINNTFLVNLYESEKEDYYKLRPTQLDRKSLEKIIDKENIDDDTPLYNCYLFFEKKIRQYQNHLDLQQLKKVVCNSLSLVSIVLGIDDDPYLVFEGLNAKGSPLNQADLIRNYYFMEISSQEQEDIYNSYWKPMEESLNNQLTEYIRHYLTRSGKEVRKNEVYFETKERIRNQDAISSLKELYKFSLYYSNLLNPETEKNEKIKKHLKRLNRLEVATIYPFILNCYDDWKQEKLSEDELCEVFKIIENFILRRFVCNIQTRGLNRIFALLYSQVSKDTNLISDSFVTRLKSTLQTRNYPKDHEFRERFMDVKMYGSNRSEKAKLILESIEESSKHKETVDFEKLSIEHIMPQKLNEWWKNHLGKEFSITHELLIHSIGNLTLTGYNSELSNNNFPTKKKEFLHSHLELNKYFSTVNSWGKYDIEKRASDLADKALEIWSYFGDNSIPDSQANSVTGKIPKNLRIFGHEYSVKSWRDVLEISLNTVADLKPDKFEDILSQFPHFVGRDEKDFRSIRKLNNGIFVEVNLSATAIHTFCLKAIETADLSQEEWNVETITRALSSKNDH